MASDHPRSFTGGILLEPGTNEVEILVFRLGDRAFGVNVAKVREVIRHQPTIDVPHKHPSVVGVFDIRDRVLTLIDLAAHLGVRDEAAACAKALPEGDDRSIVVTEFNDLRLGFLVDAIDRIHRVSWDGVLPVPPLAPNAHRDADRDASARAPLTTGIIDFADGLALLVDFESIAEAVLNAGPAKVGAIDNPHGVERADRRIVVAEDSPFVGDRIRGTLLAAGYSGVEVHADGRRAWSAITAPGRPIDAIISDIEMPRMDGLHLTKLIRSDARFAEVPVVLFSSLISPENARRGAAVGATVQLRKPELPDLVRVVDGLLAGAPLTGIPGLVTTRAA